MNKMQKLLTAILIPVMALSLILSSCSLTTSSGTGTTTTKSGNTTAVPNGTAVLNLYGEDPLTLDPATSGDAASHDFILSIFSGLVALDSNLQPVPDIAQNWTISPDGTVYTFNLRHNVKFQDGRAVTATDFKYSWERACNPATGSQTAPGYLNDIVGAADELTGKTTTLSGVKVVDDYTLQVTIVGARSYFLDKMSYPTAFVVDKNNVAKGANWWKTPNGTGPFKLQTWTAGSSFVLVRNTLYYGDVAKIASVNYKLFAGVPERLYETGDIDATSVSLPFIDEVTDKTGPYLSQLTITPELNFSYIGFNCNKPPFDDPKVRQAFSLAVDKTKLVSLVFSDTMDKANGILPPGMPGYNSGLQGLDFNPTQALALIKASKYGSVANLPPITLTTAGYGGAVGSYLEALVTEWRTNLGVDVTIRQIDPERFLYHTADELNNMFDSGWSADYPNPQDFLELLFATGAQSNYGGYSNPQVDALLVKAAAETDNAKSLADYQQAEQLLVTDAAVLPLWFGKTYTLVKPNVHGYTPNPMGEVKLNEVTIDP